jgi:hypothetical protein
LKPLYKYILTLIVFELLVLIAGFLILLLFNLNLHFKDIGILSVIFTLIILITLLIFFRGQKKKPDSQTMHTIVSLSLKFLIEMGLAVFWFIIAKKAGLSSVILFFVLYLTFTSFSIGIMLKTLKNKSL